MLKKISSLAYSKLIKDQRITFPDNRHGIKKPRAKVLQFYSSVHNIGNYMPILAGHEMFDVVPDKWCIQAKNIDFEYINNNYKGVIIGGAGLLHANFESFWKSLNEKCKLPIVIWGVGLCAPYGAEKIGVKRNIVRGLKNRLSFVNFRDELTANYYDLPRTNISFCPTIVYINDNYKANPGNQVLFALQNELEKEKNNLLNNLDNYKVKLKVTNNSQQPWMGLKSIIEQCYCKSQLIVTSKLHGAITAYSLGIPYIAFPVDKKLDEFVRLYGNGLLAHSVDEVLNHMESSIEVNIENVAKEYNSVKTFGLKVNSWVNQF